MRLFMRVKGSGSHVTEKNVFGFPQFLCKMVVRLYGKIPVYGKREIEVDCESPLNLSELSQELELISTDFYNEFNDMIEKKTIALELEGKHSDAYTLRNATPTFGYDVYEVK